MSSQTLLPANLEVVKSIEVAGLPIEVGILRDGTPFLSGRGLAKACGISNSTLVGWGEQVPQAGAKYRAGKLANLLATYGYGGDHLFWRLPSEIKFGGKANVSAYPYQVCMAFLDYYAFEANKEEARNSLRILSEKQLPTFIYAAIGYKLESPQPTVQQPERDRPLRGKVPDDYFGVFQIAARGKLSPVETALEFDPQASPHLTVEKAWNHYWTTQKLWEHHGRRLPYRRKSLDFLPQIAPDGYIKTYLYPASALPAFKQWLNFHYIPERFPSYRQRKIQQRELANWHAYYLVA